MLRKLIYILVFMMLFFHVPIAFATETPVSLDDDEASPSTVGHRSPQETQKEIERRREMIRKGLHSAIWDNPEWTTDQITQQRSKLKLTRENTQEGAFDTASSIETIGRDFLKGCQLIRNFTLNRLVPSEAQEE